MAKKSNLIGNILLRDEKITKENLDKALEIQADTNDPLGTILLNEKFIDDEGLTEGLAVQSKMLKVWMSRQD